MFILLRYFEAAPLSERSVASAEFQEASTLMVQFRSLGRQVTWQKSHFAVSMMDDMQQTSHISPCPTFTVHAAPRKKETALAADLFVF
jgi:hypothetical protein